MNRDHGQGRYAEEGDVKWKAEYLGILNNILEVNVNDKFVMRLKMS